MWEFTSKQYIKRLSGKMNKKQQQTKQTKKPAKAAKEFERVISVLDKENDVLKTQSSQLTMFAIFGILSAALPLCLIPTSIFGGRLLSSPLLYGISTVLSGALLTNSYTALSTKTRQHLLMIRPAISPTAKEDGHHHATLKKSTIDESANYALFVVNTIYLSLFFFVSCYMFAGWNARPETNFMLSSLIVSAAVAALVHSSLF